MEQLELPLKFKPNTYESYTDTQKKEYWYANYCIQLMEKQKMERKVDSAVRMLTGLISLVDESIPDFRRITVKQRIRQVCNDLTGKKLPSSMFLL